MPDRDRKGSPMADLAADDSGGTGWLGWLNADVEVTLDLKKPIAIRNLGCRSTNAAFGLVLPKQVEFFVSDDGETFRPVAMADKAQALKQHGWYAADVKDTTARYVRLRAQSGGSWTFLDEFAVNFSPPGPNAPHLAVGKPVTIPALKPGVYDAAGTQALTDGYIARNPDCANLSLARD